MLYPNFFLNRTDSQIYKIEYNLNILLTRISSQIFTLQIVNDHTMLIPFPNGFSIYDTVYNENVRMVSGLYVIVWNTSYIVSINNIPKVRILNTRKMNIEPFFYSEMPER